MKIFKNIFLIIIVIVVGWNSVYFKKLDEVKASKEQKSFDAVKYAKEFWDKKLIPGGGQAIELSQLLSMITTDQARAFEDHSHALGIGNLRYFLVKDDATVEKIENDFIIINCNNSHFKVATEFIFGNAVRDATGLIDINEFTNTMDFNNVSAELNKIIRENVLPPFKSKVKPGDTIEFVGAIELNKEHFQLNNIEIIPIQLKIK
ncbi:MAG: DUF2291 domain-containing protein [Bacteroidota bacterium]